MGGLLVWGLLLQNWSYCKSLSVRENGENINRSAKEEPPVIVIAPTSFTMNVEDTGFYISLNYRDTRISLCETPLPDAQRLIEWASARSKINEVAQILLTTVWGRDFNGVMLVLFCFYFLCCFFNFTFCRLLKNSQQPIAKTCPKVYVTGIAITPIRLSGNEYHLPQTVKRSYWIAYTNVYIIFTLWIGDRILVRDFGLVVFLYRNVIFRTLGMYGYTVLYIR